jgi:DNA-binding NarL/FixJ family response regulator
MINVLIADDHGIVRKGLREIIDDEPGMHVCGEATSAAEALASVRTTPTDVLILDINLPDRSGLDVLLDIKRVKPRLPVLVFSMHPEEQFAVRVLKSGASGYLTKDAASEEIVIAIRQLHAGRKYVSPRLGELLVADLSGEMGRPPHELLSHREFEVLRLIASGKTVSEIAGILSLSVKTISTYRTRILEKMHMKSNAELTHYAIKNSLVT